MKQTHSKSMYMVEQKEQKKLSLYCSSSGRLWASYRIQVTPVQRFFMLIHNLLKHTAYHWNVDTKLIRTTLYCFQSVWLFDCAEFRLPDSGIEIFFGLVWFGFFPLHFSDFFLIWTIIENNTLYCSSLKWTSIIKNVL